MTNKVRQVEIGTSKYTKVYSVDDDLAFNAHHSYVITDASEDINSAIGASTFANINFQKGPVKENGVNGCHNEDLIAIVIDRLQHLNQGQFACRENSIAITKLEEALMWLRKRTDDRVKRGVEGTNQV